MVYVTAETVIGLLIPFLGTTACFRRITGMTPGEWRRNRS